MTRNYTTTKGHAHAVYDGSSWCVLAHPTNDRTAADEACPLGGHSYARGVTVDAWRDEAGFAHRDWRVEGAAADALGSLNPTGNDDQWASLKDVAEAAIAVAFDRVAYDALRAASATRAEAIAEDEQASKALANHEAQPNADWATCNVCAAPILEALYGPGWVHAVTEPHPFERWLTPEGKPSSRPYCNACSNVERHLIHQPEQAVGSYHCPCGWSRAVLEGQTMAEAKAAHEGSDVHAIATETIEPVTEEQAIAAVASARAEVGALNTLLTRAEAEVLVALWADHSLPTGLVVMQFGYSDVDDWVGMQEVDDLGVDDEPMCLASEAPGAPDPATFLAAFREDAEVERLVEDGYSVGEAEDIAAHDDGDHHEESEPGCPRCADTHDPEDDALTPAWRQHLASRHEHQPGVEPESPRLPCILCDTPEPTPPTGLDEVRAAYRPTHEETTATITERIQTEEIDPVQTIDLTPGNAEQANMLTYLARAFAEQAMVPNAYGAIRSVIDLARCLQANDAETLKGVMDELDRMEASFGPDTPAGKAARIRSEEA
jgi:hypothetical protein